MRKTCAKPVKNRLDTGPHSEPPTGIDPVTSFLPRTRSTTELGGQRVNTLPEDSPTNKSAAGRRRTGRKQRKSGLPGRSWGPESAPGTVGGRGCDEANTAAGMQLNKNGPAQGAGPFSDGASGYHLLRGLKPPSVRGLRVSAPKVARSERSLKERPPRSAEDAARRRPCGIRVLKPPLPLKLPLPPE